MVQTGGMPTPALAGLGMVFTAYYSRWGVRNFLGQ